MGSNQTPMNTRTAAPMKIQIQTAVQEYHRRLRNTSRELPVSTVEQVLRDWSLDLRRGGYSQKWVMNCLDSAMKGYIRKVKTEIEGGVPINRPESLGRKARRIKKLVGKSSWFKRKQDDKTGEPTNG